MLALHWAAWPQVPLGLPLGSELSLKNQHNRFVKYTVNHCDPGPVEGATFELKVLLSLSIDSGHSIFPTNPKSYCLNSKISLLWTCLISDVHFLLSISYLEERCTTFVNTKLYNFIDLHTLFLFPLAHFWSPICNFPSPAQCLAWCQCPIGGARVVRQKALCTPPLQLLLAWTSYFHFHA